MALKSPRLEDFRSGTHWRASIGGEDYWVEVTSAQLDEDFGGKIYGYTVSVDNEILCLLGSGWLGLTQCRWTQFTRSQFNFFKLHSVGNF